MNNETMMQTYSDFNQLAIRDRFSMYLRVWYWLRHHDENDCGWLPKKKVNVILNQLYSPSRRREILRNGQGVWWDYSGDGLEIRGIKSVARKLRCLPGKRVLVPIEAISNNQVFKAYLYTTFFAKASRRYFKNGKRGIPGKSITREKLEELFGISPRTQRRYEKITFVEVTKQFGSIKMLAINKKGIKSIIKEFNNKGKKYWFKDIDKDGIIELCWQIGNSYLVNSVVYAGNMNRCIKGFGGILLSGDAKPDSYKRIYFENPEARNKAVKKFDYRNVITYQLAQTPKTVGNQRFYFAR